MRSMRLHYWACSKFADWVRGTQKPYSLEWGEWDKWHEDAKKAHPVRYWVANTVFDKLQDIVYFPADLWYNIRCYLRNRFLERTHMIRTGLRKGQWWDTDIKLLHGMFEALVDYVELELGHGRKPRRSPARGMSHLKWEMGLIYDSDMGMDPSNKLYGKSSHQAKAAVVTRDLYLWWKFTRPARSDPYDAAPEVSKIEEDYEQEDTDMLVKLIKHRRNLWS